MMDYFKSALESKIPAENAIKLIGTDPKIVERFSISKGLETTLTFKARHTPPITYLELRKTQNKAWAYEQAMEGIALAKVDGIEQAQKKYDLAIELDDNCVEAYVGRGCAYANQKKFTFAIEDLKMALSIDPSHKNAKDYLNTIIAKRKKKKLMKKEANRQLQDGEFLLPERYSENKRRKKGK